MSPRFSPSLLPAVDRHNGYLGTSDNPFGRTSQEIPVEARSTPRSHCDDINVVVVYVRQDVLREGASPNGWDGVETARSYSRRDLLGYAFALRFEFGQQSRRPGGAGRAADVDHVDGVDACSRRLRDSESVVDGGGRRLTPVSR